MTSSRSSSRASSATHFSAASSSFSTASSASARTGSSGRSGPGTHPSLAPPSLRSTATAPASQAPSGRVPGSFAQTLPVTAHPAAGSTSVPPWSSRPLSNADVSLASYITARSLVGRPLSSTQSALLRSANATLDETRNSLPWGRGNVASDAIATDHQSRYRASAARSLTHEWNRQYPTYDGTRHVAHSAAASLSFGAGRCGEYSATAAVLHSPRMAPDDEVHVMFAPGHNWTEVRSSRSANDPVVIDGWSRGPAVLASDSAMAATNRFSAVSLDRQSARQALTQARALEHTMRQDPQGMQRRIDSQVPYAPSLANWVSDRVAYSDAPVASSSFIGEVRTRLQQGGSRATAQDAVRTARALGSSPTTLHDDVKHIDAATRRYFGGE